MKIKGHILYQHSIFSALMAADFYGSIAMNKLLIHGDFGLGTFHGGDGELVIVSGKAYHVKPDGTVSVAKKDLTTPFATVTHFVSDHKLAFKDITYHELQKELEAFFPSLNLFYAIKITGSFESVVMRALKKQNEPFVSIKEMAKEQEELTVNNLAGTMVVFWTPQFANTIAVQGFHSHFLSKDYDLGGHTLDFYAKEIQVEISCLTDMKLHLPTTKSFLHHHVETANLQEDIKNVESQQKITYDENNKPNKF